jgi:hypothetical protein
MNLSELISRWADSGDAERANKDSFLNELCDVLGVERPRPKVGDPARDVYVFEKDVPRSRAGGSTIGWVDLYKAGCFLLEAKQGAAAGPKRRDSPAWNQMMSAALESLAAVGVAIEMRAGAVGGRVSGRRWGLVR